MAKYSFLGQGLGRLTDTAADVLIRSFADETFNEFSCLVAFASLGGITGLSKSIKKSKKHIRKFNVFVGVDQKGTSKEALRALLDLDIGTKIFYTTRRVTFHPKIYIFEGKNHRCRIIVGSSNLTGSGLFQNIEANLMIDCDRPPLEGRCLRDQIKEYFKLFFSGECRNVRPLTPKLIQTLVDRGIVPDETERERIHETISISGKTKEKDELLDKLEELFPAIEIQKPPKGFEIRKVPRQKLLIEKPEVPKIVEREKGDLVWKKTNLPSSDVLYEKQGTNVTGCLRLTQAKWEISGVPIDQTSYFRNDVFRDFEWKVIKQNPFVEATNVLFNVKILGRDIGQHQLTIRHKPSGEAGQHNYTTSLHWGKIGNAIREAKLKGRTFLLYKPANDKKEPFYIEIV